MEEAEPHAAETGPVGFVPIEFVPIELVLAQRAEPDSQREPDWRDAVANETD